MPESRLTRRTVKQGKKQLYWSIAGIIIIIFVALNFGPLFIAALGNTIDTFIGKTNETDIIDTDSDLKPPLLDPLPKAVSEAEISVSGTSFYNTGEVKIYVNGQEQQSISLDSQTFEADNLRLREGINLIKTKIVQGNKESEFSYEYEISFLKDDPKLEVSNPADGAQFQKADREIVVSGNTDAENNVTVNDFIAIVNASGDFSYNLRLNDGENKIKIVTTNPAGKTSEKEITVSYSP